jgi:hypothetical protein
MLKYAEHVMKEHEAHTVDVNLRTNLEGKKIEKRKKPHKNALLAQIIKFTEKY